MPGFFEALSNLPKPVPKKHVVTIQGKEIQVSLQKKLEIQRAGEDNYMLVDNKIVLKPKPKAHRKFPVLCQTEHGYSFYDKDPHWVQGIVEKGHTWQIESE